jgi:gliding motility-associated-like protein
VNHFLKIISVSVIFFSAVFTEQGNCMAQKNLVPNWSFEEYNICPTVYCRDCSITSPIIPSLKDWYCAMTYESTPDFFHKCGTMASGYNNWKGYQLPHSGEAYMGAYMHPLNNPFNIEYIQCTLKDSLKPLVSYCVKYFVNCSDQSEYVISQHGAAFTYTKILEPSITLPKYLNLTPQVKNTLGNFIKDTVNWMKIEGSFIATGGEKYMTLGSFGPQSLLDTLALPIPLSIKAYMPPYIYFDDISVEEVINADAGPNRTIACGDAVRIGLDSAWAAKYTWVPSTGLVDAQVPMPIAHPTITTTYTVTKQQCEVTTTSTVTVFVTNNCPYINYLDGFMIPNVFTPNGDNSNDVWQFTLGLGNNLKSLHIYDRWGLEVKSSQIQSQSFIKWDGYTTAGEPCTAGVYFYILEYSNVLGEQNKLNGYITLIK